MCASLSSTAEYRPSCTRPAGLHWGDVCPFLRSGTWLLSLQASRLVLQIGLPGLVLCVAPRDRWCIRQLAVTYDLLQPGLARGQQLSCAQEKGCDIYGPRAW